MDCAINRIRTLSQSRVLKIGAADGDPVEAMVSTDRMDDFRLTRCRVQLGAQTVQLDDDARRVLDLNDGDTARIWVNS